MKLSTVPKENGVYREYLVLSRRQRVPSSLAVQYNYQSISPFSSSTRSPVYLSIILYSAKSVLQACEPVPTTFFYIYSPWALPVAKRNRLRSELHAYLI